MGPLSWIMLGSQLLRTLAGDSKVGRAAGAVADILDQTKDEAAVEQRVKALPPEIQKELKELEVRALEIGMHRERKRLEATNAQQARQHEAWAKEMQSRDAYVRHTRPSIARWSVISGLVYALSLGVLFPFINSASSYLPIEWIYIPTLPDSPEPWVLTAIFSPAGFYIGARTADAFSGRGKT